MKNLLRHTVYAICGFLIAAISNSSAWAQDSLAQYHPLGKGNIWIYYFSHPWGNNYYQRLEVVGDSTIDGKVYRIMAETSMDGTIIRHSSVERYDDTTGCYFTRSGNVDILQDSTFTSTPHVLFGANSNKRVLNALGWNTVLGTRRLSRQVSEAMLLKEDMITWQYSYGLGLEFAYDQQLFPIIDAWVQTLVYAKIDGVEYGKIPVKVEDRNIELPSSIVLSQNYPNPFNPSTTISFTLSSKSFVTLKIFDVMGREAGTIATEDIPAGRYSYQWNASGMPSGVYFYRLQAGSYTETKRLLLLR